MGPTSATANGLANPDQLTVLSELVLKTKPDHDSVDLVIRQAQDMLAQASGFDQAEISNALACLYFTRFQAKEDPQALENALDLTKKVQTAPICRRLSNARYLSTMSNNFAQLSKGVPTSNNEYHASYYLDLAIRVARAAIAACPGEKVFLFNFIRNLGVLHEMRYKRNDGDIDQLILWAEEAVTEIPENHPSKARHLTSLSAFLQRKFLDNEEFDFEVLGRAINHAAHAVEIIRNAMDIPPQDQLFAMEHLIDRLRTRFERQFDHWDLKRLIQWTSELSSKCSSVVPHLDPTFQNELGYWYIWAHRVNLELDAGSAIDQAIDCFKKASDRTNGSSAEKMGYLNNYVDALRRRSEAAGVSADEETRSCADLNKAISVGYAALKEMPYYRSHLTNLADALGRRYQQLGSPEDIEEAIRLGEGELLESPFFTSSEGKAATLINLSNWYGFRFERMLDSRDINEAILHAQLSVQATGQGSYELGSRLNTLGRWFGLRYSRTAHLHDLASAIAYGRRALMKTPPGHPQHPQHANNLAVWLGWKYERPPPEGKLSEDLANAIRHLESVVQVTPEGHLDYALYQGNLGKFLAWRYRITKLDYDIEKALQLGHEAAKATKPNHPDMARYLSNLAEMYRLRHNESKQQEDQEALISILKQIISLDASPPTHRINAIMENTTWLESGARWSDLSEVTEAAVNLLPLVSTRSLTEKDQQSILRRYAKLTSLAAAAALQAGKSHYEAVALLERGRGVISALQFDIRSDLSELKATQHAHLAADFERLRDELNFSLESSSFSGSSLTTSKQHIVSRLLDDKIKEIRSVEGFKTFMEHPDEDQLKRAAGLDGTIVIINTSFRSDALIVRRDDIMLCQLKPELLLELEREMKGFAPRRNDISGTLEWLWDSIARPVLEHLNITKVYGTSDDVYSCPRVCWIPTGSLCSLPLHAAGYHFDGSCRAVLERVVSSYSPSIKALLYAQNNMAHRPGVMRSPDNKESPERAILLSMPTTPGMSDLEFADYEKSQVRDCLLQASGVSCSTPSSLDRLGVMTALPGSKFFHFAGHGLTDRFDPSQSGIVLKDGVKLTVADLRTMMLHQNPPFLAYLSACSTGRNRDSALQDEGIHLMGACQVAGFQNVVGSLWAVSDRRCVEVAESVYGMVIEDINSSRSDSSVARGLHVAVRRLRDATRYPARQRRRGELDSSSEDESQDICRGDPSLWAAYIHVGFH